ncbi:hypothetical protein, partial [Actinacidiphila rubida]
MTAQVARTMGQGLTRLESYLPSTRGATLFGEVRRMLDHAPEAQQAAQRMVDEAASFGAAASGRLARYTNERNRTFWERNFGVSPRKRAEEAELVEALAALGGVVGGGLARAKVRHDDRRRREAVGRLVWQVVNVAALARGSVNAYNDALRWRVLDALELDPRTRDQLAAAPVPASQQALVVPQLEPDARDAVATYAFHAYANAVGEEEAARRIVPLLVRLGMSVSGGEHFARTARVQYRSELDPLAHHYSVLQVAVAGIGRHLFLPVDVIADAVRRVVAYDPYEAARAENRRMVLQLVQAGGGLGALVSGGTVGPAMSIATAVAQQVFGPAAAPP